MLFLENCVNCVFLLLCKLFCEQTHWMLLYRCTFGWLNPHEIYVEAADYRHYSLADKQGGKSSALLLTCVCLPLQSIWISQSTAAASLRGMHPLSIQYYDSLSLNCFLRGPCSPYLGKLAALPLMHHDGVKFLLELLGKAVCLWAAT